MSHDYHHGDCDHILATDKDDVCNNHSSVEEIGFDKGKWSWFDVLFLADIVSLQMHWQAASTK